VQVGLLRGRDVDPELTALDRHDQLGHLALEARLEREYFQAESHRHLAVPHAPETCASLLVSSLACAT
jgi:hypothetical protein